MAAAKQLLGWILLSVSLASTAAAQEDGGVREVINLTTSATPVSAIAELTPIIQTSIAAVLKFPHGRCGR